MKKLTILIYMLIMLILPSTVNAEALQLQYDGEVHDYTGSIFTLMVNNHVVEPPLPPIIFNDRALVPIREVFEAMGATVNYEDDTKKVSVNSNSVTVDLQINSNDAYVNGQKTSIPDGVVPKLIGRVGEYSKTMVPVRFISESIGMEVLFDGENGIIRINQPTPTPEPTPTPTPTPTPEPTPEVKKPVITMVGFQETDDGVDIVIKGDDDFEGHSSSFLTDPYRIVIDVENAILSTSQNSYDLGIRSVDKIRLGQHEDSTRVVVDMSAKLDYKISTSGKNMYVSIIAPETSGTPAPKPSGDANAGNDKPGGSINSQNPTISTPAPTTEKIVVLDAGHGGKDPGTSGVDNSGTKYSEKDVALLMQLKVRDILIANGVSVIMTRSDDTFLELEDRSAVANNANAALFVSLHLNSNENPAPSGTEVYYAKSNNSSGYGITSQKLADNVRKSLVSSVGFKDRGTKTANHVVTRMSKMPAILIEVGFMSNPEEMTKMASEEFQAKVAQGVAEGIINSLSSVTVPAATPVPADAIEYMTD